METVRILLFAGLGEKVGRQMEWPWRAGLTIEGLIEEMGERHPEVRAYAPTLMTAVNAVYRPRSWELRAGDEVALIPPVSGG
ncbi:MAG: MoaD/ThiS family protein [Hydrogenibacillus sp.]|nr:MoaD/ThiS family protein [Hydrogenibacillus sp.]